MLTLIGDILNWLAAGVLFPLLLLPLAGLIEKRRTRTVNAPTGAVVWGFFVIATAFAALLFLNLAPRLDYKPNPQTIVIFAATVGVLMIAIAIAGGPVALTRVIAPPLERVTRIAGRLAMWLVLLMAFVQFSVVILRYVFGLNFIFMQEGVTYMHGAVFLLAGGYTLLTDDHVRVDIFYRGAAPRRKALIDFLGTYLLLFPISLLILWTATGYVGNSWAVGEGSNEQSGIPALFLLKSLIPAFAVLMAMAGFVIAARAGETLRGEGR